MEAMPSRAKPEQSAAPFVPADHSLDALADAARRCEGCDLYRNATQTVFGEGNAQADIMLVGEQPGDKEDVEGRPFVGPSGMLLNHCLEESGIDRSRAYVTNAVKHFKWEPRGRRRIHKKPNTLEIAACRPWFDAEVAAVAPRIIVCLGATSAQALLGASFRVTQRRGEVIALPGLPPVLATVHPSSILRAVDQPTRARETELFINDLRVAATYLASPDRKRRGNSPAA